MGLALKMNDFTKAELIELMEWMEEAEAEHSTYPKKVLLKNSLYNKIQSMIENYCEHEWENPCCGCPNSACFCTKCDKRL